MKNNTASQKGGWYWRSSGLGVMT